MTRQPPHIRPARSNQDIALARALMSEFMDWLHERYRERLWQVETYYDADGWRAELEGLPGRYAPPAGEILLAFAGDAPAGCVALQPLGPEPGRKRGQEPEVCEVNRMFIRPEFHGRGVATALMRALMDTARERGYALMRLETGDLQPEAISLYRRLGFRDAPAYHEHPPRLEDVMVHMEIGLGGGAASPEE